MPFVRGQLWVTDLGSEVEPVPPQRAGPQSEPANKFSSGAADRFSAESRL